MARGSQQSINPGRAARKVLIIKLSALGDIVMSLGAMREIRQAHPAASITWLTTPAYKAFAEKCPFVDRVETDGRPEKMKDSSALVNRLRHEKYDIIYDLHCSDRTANYFRMMNLPGRRPPVWSGHAKGAKLLYDPPERKQIPPIDRHARQLEAAGLGPFPSPPLPALDWAFRDVDTNPRLQPAYFNLSGPFAIVAGGSSDGHPDKRWPPTSYAEIANRLEEHGLEPVLIGTVEDGETNTEIGRDAPRARNLTTRTDLFQLAALASKANLVIGNDTGPLHLAAAAGAPAIALFSSLHSQPDTVVSRSSPILAVVDEKVENIPVDTVWQMIRAMGVLPK